MRISDWSSDVCSSDLFGLATILWLLILVWAIDVGAYVVGRNVGGPKLAPVISPKKTWSGLAGGVAAAGIVGAVAGLVIDGAAPLPLALVRAVLALVEQAGDLGESAVTPRLAIGRPPGGDRVCQ